MKNILLFFACVFYTQVWAYDFVSNGIYYNKSSSNTVSVTYNYDVEYEGSITVPQSVIFNGTTYSVVSIGNYAFENCSSLTSIVIPNTVSSIGDHAFYGCGLTSITIHKGVTTIGQSAFYGCPFTEIKVDSNNPSFCSIDGVLFNKTQTALILYPKRNSQTIYTIPSSVNSIESVAFANSVYLYSISIPNSVKTISRQAFMNCIGLSSITIPASVSSIGVSAFSICRMTNIYVDERNPFYSSSNGVLFNKNKTKIIEYLDGLPNSSYSIPSSVTEIGDYAFYQCEKLIEINIPNSVNIIGQNAFGWCENLSSINIPNSVTTIKQFAFELCRNLKALELPASITSIEDHTFSGCFSLTSLNIPVSVTSIGEGGFAACSFSSITIPASVTSIGLGAFFGCESLASIHANSNIPIDLPNPIDLYYAEVVFSNIHSEATLYVPKGSKSAYQSANQWKSFTNIVEEEIINCKISVSANPITAGTLEGTTGNYSSGSSCMVTAKANLGYTFSNWIDSKGNILSPDKNFSFVLISDTNLVANFSLTPSTSIEQPTTTKLTGTITVFPSSNYTYSIDGTNYQNSNVFSGLGIGSYLITLKDKNGTISQPIIAEINASGVVSSQNYEIKVSNVTCRGNADGEIQVTTLALLNYAISITGANINKTEVFNGTLYKLTNLLAGSYEVCFSISGLINYKQQFTVTISEPQDLNVYKVSQSNSSALYTLNGGTNYFVVVNDRMIETQDDSVKVALHIGENRIRITTGKICQGVYEETIYFNGINQISLFPNPTDGMINIGIQGKDEEVIIEIFSMNGDTRLKQNLTVPQNKIVSIDGSSLPNGAYIIGVNGITIHSTMKIVKR